MRVEPLTHESYVPRAGHKPVQWLETDPRYPYIKIARIIATSQSADEDRLRDKILSHADMLGADAVVAGKFDILESLGPGPLFESTLGPSADNSGPYTGVWGWWNPFYYDPWSFVQLPGDQVDQTEYLSGTAIRYLNGT